MQIFYHYESYKQDFDKNNFKIIFKKSSKKLINIMEINTIVRSLIFFISIYIVSNSLNMFISDLNFKLKFSNFNPFFEIDFSELSNFLFCSK